ncbi:MAG: cell division protein ZapA [Acidobacteria bacterium]|nr:cell division protein ZapA [Acidobacteriota bacterium]
MSKSVKVEIFDQSYQIRGALDEAYVKKLAAYVDEKMRSVAEATRTIDSVRVAVLAALNIADEFHSLQSRHEEVSDDLRARTERCLSMVEKALK